jgi:hypothetical protein
VLNVLNVLVVLNVLIVLTNSWDLSNVSGRRNGRVLVARSMLPGRDQRVAVLHPIDASSLALRNQIQDPGVLKRYP